VRFASILVVLSALSCEAEARTWTVGGPGADFPLISPAIAAASDGDVIMVAAGVYRENLVINKRLAIVGVGRPTLLGTGVGTVVMMLAGGSALRGFTVEASGTGQTNAMDAAIHLSSNGNYVEDNVLRRVFYGVVVANAAHNHIADNDIHGLAGVPFGRRGDGIYLYRAPDNVVARNRITGERDAIYFQYAPRGRAVGNVVTASRYALHAMFSDDVVISRNTLAASAVGANIMNSRRIRLEANRFVGNSGVPGVGLTVKDCDQAIVRENTRQPLLRERHGHHALRQRRAECIRGQPVQRQLERRRSQRPRLGNGMVDRRAWKHVGSIPRVRLRWGRHRRNRTSGGWRLRAH
jgi:nitrous oxidase accessory protein NosD